MAADRPRGRSLVKDMKRIFRQEESASLVPAAFLAFAILDAIPTPADAGYFYTQKWLSDHRGELTKEQYWAYEYFNYYGWDVFWYLSLFVITYYGGVTFDQRLRIGIALLSLGAIATMIWRYTQRDELVPLDGEPTEPSTEANPAPEPPKMYDAWKLRR